MVSTSEFKKAAKQAVLNVTKHGDTDIFPFPFENHAFFDESEKFVELILEYDEKFEEYLTRFPPQHLNSLTPVSYSGFRWATQLDPIWNAHFLACVLALSKSFENVRIPKKDQSVFSYRYKPDVETGDLFDRDVGWFQFMEHSINLSIKHEYVVVCDISEFYPRLGHHRLENALKQVAGDTAYPGKIMKFLSNFSNTRSFGLPIGGPAARILSELTINQIDRLLLSHGTRFTRFADDFHLFCESQEDAYRSLIALSEKLFDNQGLSLQKSKTRIMSAAEFVATNPLGQKTVDSQSDSPASRTDPRRELLSFSLRFDPYSPTAEEDYERLSAEMTKFDIIGLLKQELAKSRVHTALTRKVISSIKFLDEKTKDDAVLSILENSDVLYPIFSTALLMIYEVFESLSESTRKTVGQELRDLITSQSHIVRVDLHLAYALRVLGKENSPENQLLLQQVYTERSSPLVRRDVILILAKWGEWYWLSDLRNRFRELSGPERRAFILASYALKDEGSHWRDHIKKELSPFEKKVVDWAAGKSNVPGWSIPI